MIMCMMHTTLYSSLDKCIFRNHKMYVDIWKSNRIERNTTSNDSTRCICSWKKEEQRKSNALGDEITFACECNLVHVMMFRKREKRKDAVACTCSRADNVYIMMKL